MRSIRPAVLLIALAVPAFAGAQAPASRPDFSGTWVMDREKSPGPMIPEAMSYTIQQRGDTVRIKRYSKTMQGENTSDLVYGLDGKPWKNTATQGGMAVDVSSVLTWEGATLVITSTLLANGQEIHQVEKWTLGADGMSLTSNRTVEAMGQSFAATMVFNKSQ